MVLKELLIMTLLAFQSISCGKLKDKVKALKADVKVLQNRVSALEENTAQLCYDSDWMHYNESIYYVSTSSELLNWTDAQAFCESKGATLLTIESQGEHEFIKLQVRLRDAAGTGNFYTAGNDLLSEDTWVWGNPTITAIDVTYWYPGQPTNFNDNEDCLEYRAQFEYLWNDIPCDTVNRFVCERSIIA